MERDIKNKSHLNFELTNALSAWQKMPDSKEYVARVGGAITAAFRYGCVDGYSIVFESSPELAMRTGSMKGKNYLFLDSRTEKTIGFFRPEDIMELKTK